MIYNQAIKYVLNAFPVILNDYRNYYKSNIGIFRIVNNL